MDNMTDCSTYIRSGSPRTYFERSLVYRRGVPQGVNAIRLDIRRTLWMVGTLLAIEPGEDGLGG